MIIRLSENIEPLSFHTITIVVKVKVVPCCSLQLTKEKAVWEINLPYKQKW